MYLLVQSVAVEKALSTVLMYNYIYWVICPFVCLSKFCCFGEWRVVKISEKEFIVSLGSNYFTVLCTNQCYLCGYSLTINVYTSADSIYKNKEG